MKKQLLGFLILFGGISMVSPALWAVQSEFQLTRWEKNPISGNMEVPQFVVEEGFLPLPIEEMPHIGPQTVLAGDDLEDPTIKKYLKENNLFQAFLLHHQCIENLWDNKDQLLGHTKITRLISEYPATAKEPVLKFDFGGPGKTFKYDHDRPQDHFSPQGVTISLYANGNSQSPADLKVSIPFDKGNTCRIPHIMDLLTKAQKVKKLMNQNSSTSHQIQHIKYDAKDIYPLAGQ